MNTCETCKHCSKGETDPQTLQRVLVCKRYPPQSIPILTPNGTSIMTSQPQVKANFDCGEYSAALQS